MKTIIAVLILTAVTACGMETKEEPITQSLPEVSVEKPDFDDWYSMNSATDDCSVVGINEEMHCSTRFMAGENDNCPLAVFKFVAVKDGYMFVQTKKDVIIRQGEFHNLDWQEKPEVYRVDDKDNEAYRHYFYCVEQN
jgi:hypothetical protein